MDVCFITEKSLNEVWQNDVNNLAGSKLLIFGFNGLGLVSYKKELIGETEYFQDLAKFSKQTSSVVICGADTDNYGIFRHSAVIAENGKILGVSDMVYMTEDSEYAPGNSFRVYQTSIGRIGIILGEDLFFQQTTSILSMCDADFIVCLFKQLTSVMPEVVLRANSFCNGTAMAICAKNRAVVTNSKGEIVVSKNDGFIKGNIKKGREYSVVITQKKGGYDDNDWI